MQASFLLLYKCNENLDLTAHDIIRVLGSATRESDITQNVFE